MGFAIPTTYQKPGEPVGAQWVFQALVKTFETNTVAQLETAINVWLLSLNTNSREHILLAINYQSGAKERAIVSYGVYINVADL